MAKLKLEIFESNNSKVSIEQLRCDSDTIEAFLMACCEKGDSDNDRVDRTELYDKYTEYCKEAEREAHRKTNFFKALRNKGIPFKESHGKRWFTYIRLKGVDRDGFMEVGEYAEEEGGIPFDA